MKFALGGNVYAHTGGYGIGLSRFRVVFVQILGKALTNAAAVLAAGVDGHHFVTAEPRTDGFGRTGAFQGAGGRVNGVVALLVPEIIVYVFKTVKITHYYRQRQSDVHIALGQSFVFGAEAPTVVKSGKNVRAGHFFDSFQKIVLISKVNQSTQSVIQHINRLWYLIEASRMIFPEMEADVAEGNA